LKRRQVKRSYKFSLPTDRKIKREESGIVKKPVKTNWFKLVKKYAIYLMLILVLVYIVFISSIFKISRVDVQGPNSILSQDLETETNKYIKSLLTGNNWIFLNPSDLKKQLQKTFTGQESIIVNKKFPNKLEVKTDEQKSAIIWKTGSRRYIISINGRTMDEAKDQNSSALPTVVDGSNIPVNNGDKVASRDFVDFVVKLDGYFKANKIAIEQYSIAETTSELNVKTAGGYTIKFNTSDPTDSQIRALGAALELLKSQNKKPAEYLDLRVTGRAFYK
jgi:hypothetical protein